MQIGVMKATLYLREYTTIYSSFDIFLPDLDKIPYRICWK